MNTTLKLKRGDEQGPGIVRVISGRLIDLHNPQWKDIDINDIAWSISKQIRYNGHIPYDYTVARHSIIMSYFVAREYAMEALLHDAGEAYTGDIIYPIKLDYPEMEDLEDSITGVIMIKYNGGKQSFRETKNSKMRYVYHKSDEISFADKLIAQHECFRFDRPGQYVPEMDIAEQRAQLDVDLGSLQYIGMCDDKTAFLKRFYMLYDQNIIDGS